jgi:hypothetical protein
MQVKRYDYTFGKQELYGIHVHSAKQNLGVFSDTYTVTNSITNEQAGFNVEQIKKINIQGVKPFDELLINK